MADNSAVLSWEKLIPVTNSNDVAESLRCEIQDPLWLLSRQWQMGEFNAEDTGMAAFAHIISVNSPLQRFLPDGQTTARAYQSQEMPVHSLTEGVNPSFDLSLSLESGHYWKKLLLKADKQTAWDACRKNPDLQFKMPTITYEPGNESINSYAYEPFEQMMASVQNGRMVDGWLLYQQLGSHKASDLSGQPDPVVDALGDQWLLWLKNNFGITPSASKTSWDAAALEYRAAASAALPDGTVTCLQLPEHNGQLMDSYSWQLGPQQDELTKDLDPALINVERQTFMPSPLTFPGMPSARWWEFEDSTIDLSNIQANKTDLGLLILSEFSLKYSNDWLLIPLELPLGNLVQVRSMRVKDVFGVQSYIRPCPQDENWELFQLTTKATPAPRNWLFLPPVANNYLQGPVLEEIDFIRDEMANLAWGVEMTVPNGLGEGIDGKSLASQLENWLRLLAGQPDAGASSLPGIGASYNYSIGNTVPPHWIPFIPLRLSNSGPQINFRRAAMPRFIGQDPPVRIRPRTNILKTNTDDQGHYDLREEEIISSGLNLRQTWRRTRWYDGRTITWLARQKNIGRNTQSSGLKFDQAS
jgi:hypothetical protein